MFSLIVSSKQSKWTLDLQFGRRLWRGQSGWHSSSKACQLCDSLPPSQLPCPQTTHFLPVDRQTCCGRCLWSHSRHVWDTAGPLPACVSRRLRLPAQPSAGAHSPGGTWEPAEACAVVKAPKRTAPATAARLPLTADPSARRNGATKGSPCGRGVGNDRTMREREGRTSFEGQCHRKGRRKRKLREKAEITSPSNREEWGGQGKLSLSPQIFSPTCVHSPSSPAFHTPTPSSFPKPHSCSQVSVPSLSHKSHAFLQTPGSENRGQHESKLAGTAQTRLPSPKAPKIKAVTWTGSWLQVWGGTEHRGQPLPLPLCAWLSRVLIRTISHDTRPTPMSHD